MVGAGATAHPQAVLPHVAREVCQTGSGSRRALAPEGVGVCLVELGAVLAEHVVLVKLTFLGARHKAAPHAAGSGLLQRVGRDVPLIELANDRNRLHLRRPHRKGVAFLAVTGLFMSTHLLPATVPVALGQQIQVVVGNGILAHAHGAFLLAGHQGHRHAAMPSLITLADKSLRLVRQPAMAETLTLAQVTLRMDLQSVLCF